MAGSQHPAGAGDGEARARRRSRPEQARLLAGGLVVGLVVAFAVLNLEEVEVSTAGRS